MRLQLSALAGLLTLAAAPVAVEGTLAEHRDLSRRSGDARERPSVEAPAGTRVAARLDVYSKDDGLSVVTPILTVRQKIFDASEISLAYDADVLSAATVDVRTSATDKFKEIRHGVALAGEHRVPTWDTDLNAAISYRHEADDQSLTVGGGTSTERLDKNLTLGGGYSFVANPVGRSHTPTESFHDRLSIHALGLSATQLLSKTTYLQLSGSLIGAFGDQASVYRYVPLFLDGDVEAGALSEATLLDGSARPRLRPAEHLPRSRIRGAGVVRMNHYLPWRMIAAADDRLCGDAWAVLSHTFAAQLYQRLGPVIVRLRSRFYVQRAASFYEEMYTVATPAELPEFHTLDRELSICWYGMAGLEIELELSPGGLVELLTVDAKVDGQRAHYDDFACLANRSAWIVGGGFPLET